MDCHGYSWTARRGADTPTIDVRAEAVQRVRFGTAP